MNCTAKYHDTYSAAHNHRCVCPKAVEEHRRRGKIHQVAHFRGVSLRVPAVGTLRRIQALQCLGYSTLELKAHLGRPTNNKANLWPRSGRKRSTPDGMMNRATADKWSAVYERLSMIPATGPRANHIAAMALRKGWAPPLAWDDIDDPDEKPKTPRRRDQERWARNDANRRARLQPEKKAA